MWLANRAIHFGAAVGHAVDEMFAGDSYEKLGSGDDRIDVRSQDPAFVIVDRCHCRTNWVADATLADEVKAVLGADTVDRGKVDAVFHRPAVD